MVPRTPAFTTRRADAKACVPDGQRLVKNSPAYPTPIRAGTVARANAAMAAAAVAGSAVAAAAASAA